MKVILCGSISKSDEILKVRDDLTQLGHEVEIPEGVKRPELRTQVNATHIERADTKIKHDLIRGYYNKMKGYDAVVIVNAEKNGIDGYIGGNTFIEMAFAHILEKPLYCLYDLPNMPYLSEMLAMKPVILHGDLKPLE